MRHPSRRQKLELFLLSCATGRKKEEKDMAASAEQLVGTFT